MAPNQVTTPYEDYQEKQYFDPHGQLTQVLLISTTCPDNAKIIYLPTILLQREYALVQKQYRIKNNLTETTTSELIDVAFRTNEVKQVIKGKLSRKNSRVSIQRLLK